MKLTSLVKRQKGFMLLKCFFNENYGSRGCTGTLVSLLSASLVSGSRSQEFGLFKLNLF